MFFSFMCVFSARPRARHASTCMETRSACAPSAAMPAEAAEWATSAARDAGERDAGGDAEPAGARAELVRTRGELRDEARWKAGRMRSATGRRSAATGGAGGPPPQYSAAASDWPSAAPECPAPGGGGRAIDRTCTPSVATGAASRKGAGPRPTAATQSLQTGLFAVARATSECRRIAPASASRRTATRRGGRRRWDRPSRASAAPR